MGYAGSRSKSLVWLILANLLWAGQGIAVKMLEPVMHPIAIAILPLYIITLLLSSALLWGRSNARSRYKTAWKFRNQFLLAGVGGQLLAQVGMTLGISRSLASDGAILNSLVPIFSAIIATFLLRERLTPLRIGALGLGLIGVLLLSPVRVVAPLATTFTPGLCGNFLIALGCLGSAL
jgi:drug/metabolite transporter (DMT)-like permease